MQKGEMASFGCIESEKEVVGSHSRTGIARGFGGGRLPAVQMVGYRDPWLIVPDAVTQWHSQIGGHTVADSQLGIAIAWTNG